MSRPRSVEGAFAAASAFLLPVTDREQIREQSGSTIVERLKSTCSPPDFENISSEDLVISEALVKLQNIRDVLFSDTTDASTTRVADYLYQPGHRRTINILLDLIVLEGIYPHVSPGVGIPLQHRVRSLLPEGAIETGIMPQESAVETSGNIFLLEKIADGLLCLLKPNGKEFRELVEDRILSDIIAATMELAYGPAMGDQTTRLRFQGCIRSLIADTPISRLLPSLTPLLHLETPPWLRSELACQLSLLPMRPLGVRQTIDFMASRSSPGHIVPTPVNDQTGEQADSAHHGPPLSLEVMMQASNLLSAVPSSMDARTYFAQLAPQLFSLLDGDAGVEMSRVASYIIASGILARRKYGAPGSAGWEAFAMPILSRIDPIALSEPLGKVKLERFPVNDIREIVVEVNGLSTAVSRLEAIVNSHPNPALTKRLLRPLVVALWALYNVAHDSFAREHPLVKQSFSLLQTYLKLSSGQVDILLLSDSVLSKGSTSSGGEYRWIYQQNKKPGYDSGIAVHRTAARGQQGYVNDQADEDEVEDRVERLVKLLKASVNDEERIGTFILICIKKWLATSVDETSSTEVDWNKYYLDLAVVKLNQKLLTVFKDSIRSSSGQILTLVAEVLANFVRQDKILVDRSEALRSPSLSKLSSIVDVSSFQPSISPTDTCTANSPLELATIALSLLSTVLSALDMEVTASDTIILHTILPSLQYLVSQRRLADSLTSTSASLSALISFLTSTNPSSSPFHSSRPSTHLDESRKILSLAHQYLIDPLPPVRAEGLSLLTSLITTSCPLVDIPATTVMLTTLLQDSDSFIYLSAIKTLSLLADKHSSTVTHYLADAYLDPDETLALDPRLRIGETILNIVQQLGETFVEETARRIGQRCLTLAGRRGQRPKTQSVRAKRVQREQTTQREADEAWGGEVPQLGEGDPGDTVQEAQNEILARIVDGWEGFAGEEDVRIRASALSIFGAAISVNVRGLGARLTSEGIDLAMGVLTLEREGSKAILRRAAVVMVGELVRAMESARGAGRRLGLGFEDGGVEDMRRVLGWVAREDEDILVRENAGVVMGELEEWRLRTSLGVSTNGESDDFIGNLGRLDGGLRGLMVNPEVGKSSHVGKIEEIE